MHVIPIAPERVADAVTFLEERTDTALFLLSNLVSYGPALGSAPYSGDFKGIVDDSGLLIAVFCLTRRGVMIIDTHGRSDLAPAILGACESTGIPIEAVIGERRAADSVWPFIKRFPGFRVTWESPERLYRLDLDGRAVVHPRVDSRVRFLLPADFPAWNAANLAYLAEVGMSLGGTAAERRDTFDEQVAQRRWWGLFDDGRLVATATLNAVYKDTAQVGAVYTVPDLRGRRLSRATMATLIVDAREHHHLRQLVLFTGESNHAADRLYRGLGFEVVGEYGVYFGTGRTQ